MTATSDSRRGVTRGYVGALVVAAITGAAAFTVAGWGLLAMFAHRDPVSSPGVPLWLAPLVLCVALGALALAMWQQALELLRGRRGPAWGIVVVAAAGAYLIWCLGGLAGGLSIDETWVSPFAALLVPIWAAAVLSFWAVLARRVYTNRPPPRWPWERADEDQQP